MENNIQISQEIKDQLVPKYFRMNPETDDLIPNHNGLREGMKVLVGSNDFRNDIERIDTPASLDTALRYNRWFTIVKLSAGVSFTDQTVWFIGEYDDGEKQKFVFNKDQHWYVKKDTAVKKLY